ncbi:DUF6528 family protein [Amycolatopsis sp. NPDC004368]
MRRYAALAAAVVASAALVTTTPAEAAPAGSGTPIVITEQGFDQIDILDATDAAFGAAKTLWTWKPTAANGFGDLTTAWGLPDEAQLRHLGTQQYLLTTDSYGLAAVVPYPQGTGSYWATNVGAANNPHSAELLPDGNVAVTASNGGFVRVYTASQGPRSATYAQFDLPGAHGVYYDPTTRLLWAAGNGDLVGLEIGGTPAAPSLRQVVDTPLPAGPTSYGHDVYPVRGNTDRLWVTTVAGVFQYSLSAHTFGKDFKGQATIDRPDVKSIGDDPLTGQVVTSAIQPGNACPWCTDTVDLYRPRHSLELHGGQIYKARWWLDPRA